jgi:hypothetical protein
MTKLETLKNDVLQECEDDHVGLWSVVRDVRDHCPSADDAEVRNTTLTLLGDLLSIGSIVAGLPTPDGRGFVRSNKSRASLLSHIRTEWESLGRDPSIGEIIWFTTPIPAKAETKTSK